VIGPAGTADPAVRFWLDWAQPEGALHEVTPDSALVVLPRPLQAALALPEEIAVTADPEVARDDGALLLTAGHPALDHATEQVLDRGDVGHVVLARPTPLPPGPEVLLAQARAAFLIDHGKIEPAGLPTVGLLPLLRVGALLTPVGLAGRPVPGTGRGVGGRGHRPGRARSGPGSARDR
jgi:hypothetical protein